MKIVLLGSKDFDSLEYHLADSFHYLGHYVIHLDITDIVPISYRFNYWLAKFSLRYDEFIFKNVAKEIIEYSPDLVVCTYRFINPICIKLVKKQLPNTPIIHVNPDALTTFEYQQIFVSQYDAYFSKDPYIVKFMKDKMGLNAIYLPEAFNPRVHKKPNIQREKLEEELNIDVVMFGNMYPYRANMASKLIEAGINNIVLYGARDRRFFRQELDKYFKNEFITGEKKSRILYGSKIVFNNLHYAEINSVNVKFFEIAGIGGFQICDYRPTINEYSKIEPSKFTFKTIDEAVSLIKYYLDKPKLRYELANEQYEYFLQHHTYEHRIEEIFKVLY